MDLLKKHIVITGATSGVGRELVRKLVSTNRITAIGRDAAKLAELRRDHPAISTLQCDLADLAAVERACAALLDRAEPIDILICNAAMQNEPRFTDADFHPGEIASEVTTNFTSIAFMVARLQPLLGRGDSPSTIALVNSTLALAPKTTSAVYCATKAALRSLGRSLGYQFADHGIRVSQAYLPLVDTAMTAGRGSGKISASEAAAGILDGIRLDHTEHFIGKARLVRFLHRIAPGFTAHLMRKL